MGPENGWQWQQVIKLLEKFLTVSASAIFEAGKHILHQETSAAAAVDPLRSYPPNIIDSKVDF